MLGIQYLWIDKLCIIQHDEDDWAREGSKMAQIFEGSFLTIGAAVSRNDTESLFTQDERRSSSLESYVGQRKDGSSYTIYFRIPLDYHPANSTSSRPNCEKYPLLRRAWVYQERLLAPRVLYFGEELSWECRKASACECSGVSHGIKHGYSLSLLPGFPSEKLYLQWQEMVMEFTWLQLSHEEDRLPAFSGLAQQYQQRLKSVYLAGLWRENLFADLMWYAYPELGRERQRYSTKKPRKWRAPSWSWASVEGPILFSRACSNAAGEADTESITYPINITSAKCIPSSLDPLGIVAKGQLTIEGSGRPARLKHREKCAGHDTRHYSVNSTSPYSVTISSNFTVDGQEANVDYDLIEHGLMESNSDMSIYCLYICGMSYMHRMFSHSQADFILRPAYKTWSLLLHRVDDNIFERVGLLVSEHFDGGESRFRDSLSDCTITVV
jgi:hypothetical protein